MCVRERGGGTWTLQVNLGCGSSGPVYFGFWFFVVVGDFVFLRQGFSMVRAGQLGNQS